MSALDRLLKASGYVYARDETARLQAPNEQFVYLRSRNSEPLPASLESPLFIVAAPRSGSTLVFETLARAEGLCTVGRGHWLVENIPQLRPGAPNVSSNRLCQFCRRSRAGGCRRIMDFAQVPIDSNLQSIFDAHFRIRDTHKQHQPMRSGASMRQKSSGCCLR